MEPTSLYLDQYVEDNVEIAAVDEHVGEKSPDLLLLVRVEYEGPLDVGRSVRSHCLGGVPIGQDQHVVHEHTDLEVKVSSVRAGGIQCKRSQILTSEKSHLISSNICYTQMSGKNKLNCLTRPLIAFRPLLPHVNPQVFCKKIWGGPGCYK